MTSPNALGAFSPLFPSKTTDTGAVQRHGGRVSNPGPPPSRSDRALGESVESTIAEAFEQIVYRKQVERASASLQYSKGDVSADAEGSAAQQLSFSFEAEFELTEFTRFEQRVTRAAEGAGDETRRTALLEAARSVSARFSLSIEINTSALSGFATGAEQASASGENALDQFIAFAQDALDQIDSLFNDIFTTFNGFLNGTGDVKNKFNEIFEKLQSLFQGSGEEISAASQSNVSIQLEFEFESIEITQAQISEVQAADPIVLDLDGDGFEFTDVARGANFDLLANGQRQRTAFVTGGDALLALDRNGNGRVDDGAELFGDQRGAANGFEELRKLDSNGDGIIDVNDDRFGDLRLFRDNGNGRTERGELLRLAEAGVSAIDLNYANRDEATSGGNRIAQIASFRHADGRIGRAADALLNLIV